MATSSWLRAYAGGVGVVLTGLGVFGLFFVPGWGIAGSLFQSLVGTLFVYAGLGQSDPVITRRFIGGMGVLLLLGVGTSVCANLLLGDGAGVFEPVRETCLVVGIASVLVARRAEPGVLLAALYAFGAAVVAALAAAAAAATARVRRRHAASTERPADRPAERRQADPKRERPD